MKTVPMQIGSKTFELEVARSTAEQEKGLMERDAMPANHGMIFVFPDEEERGFWMKNTRIPLDILFLTAAGKVVSISQMQAYDRTVTQSHGDARYAIELNLGAAQEAGVKPGDQLAVPPGAR